MPNHQVKLSVALLALVLISGCKSGPEAQEPPSLKCGHLIVAGESIPVPFKVTTWRDVGSYDGHRPACFFSDETLPKNPARGCNVPKRYGPRPTSMLDGEIQKTTIKSGWTLPAVQQVVDQFVIHYDACGTSHRCFEVLHDLRGLSVHFLLDVDGTLYQTLDLVHRARHAGPANSRSVGIEIAHFGAYQKDAEELDQFWHIDGDGIQIKLPERLHPPAGGPFRPASPTMARGRINGIDLVQPDYTEAQYKTLAKLTDALLSIFPRMSRQVPRLADGTVTPHVLSAQEIEGFHGVLGHWHITKHKIDPGPSFDWDRVVKDR